MAYVYQALMGYEQTIRGMSRLESKQKLGRCSPELPFPWFTGEHGDSWAETPSKEELWLDQGSGS